MRPLRTALPVVFAFVILSGMLAQNAAYANGETVITPDSYEGKEIQKVIDVLKKAGGDPKERGSPAWLSDNIKKYLDEKKIIKKSLSAGVMGENKEKGGPVYLDPLNFLPSSMTNGKGYDPNNRDHFEALIRLMETISHEKHHSENHNLPQRIGGNLREKIDGKNPMEAETWNFEINLLDKIARSYADNHCKKIPKEQPGKWVQCLEEILRIYGVKKTAIKDYNLNGYGYPVPKEKIDELDKITDELKNSGTDGGKCKH